MIETPKRKVGRPPKYGNNSLDGRIHLRVSASERGELEAWASVLRTTVSEVVRRELQYILSPNNSPKIEGRKRKSSKSQEASATS